MGQTEGSITVKKLVKPAAEVRHDYKDGALDRGLGKSSVKLTKAQDWLITMANNSVQDIPEFNREMEKKLVLTQNSKKPPFQDWQDGWNTQRSLVSWAPEQIR